ncbi:restriction endonuclease subunit S [Paenibacillus sedimenti]|uniref:Restriction endonuclease subunit S n=1 Tax=Paenibacillus sedimenti TaxID=2770274 RepID=A0A926KTT4_9BACL|nr:restriction endonuclease subunit S [Paenibacillus sedimenti]MBD0383895.1 restriction endonuclease subunit S [Paenibacillus sedimenti]
MVGKDNKPEIRFTGFTDAWEQHELREIYTERKERGYDSLQILSVSIQHGVSTEELDSDTLGKKVRRSEDKSLYKHVYFGDLVLNMMRAWQGALGVVMSEGMVSPAYITAIPSAQLYPLFMDYCLRRDEMIIQMNNLSYGVTDFRKRLYWDSFINVLCRIPSVSEQERISAFFTHLDNLITIHQRKYDKLIIVKKSMLEKMFPKDGVNAPEFRFAGFTEAWKQRKLKDISDKVIEKNVNLKFTETFTNSAEFGIISQRDFFDHDISNAANLNGYYVVKSEDFVYNPRISTFAPVGPINRNKLGRSGVMSPLYTVFRTHDIDNTFLEQYFKSRYWHSFMKLNGDSGARSDRFSIKDSVLIEMPIPYPSLKEQQKVGEYLTQFDKLITLHRRKLEKLKNIKKAMLGKMFV